MKQYPIGVLLVLGFLQVGQAVAHGQETVSVPNEVTLWYNGDNWGGSGGGAANEISSNRGYFRAYDDFIINDSPWHVTRIWCNVSLQIAGVTEASWEIRSGMAPGYGGTIVASGLSAATQTPTGRLPLWREYSITVSELNLDLAPGTYWLNVAPLVGEDPGGGGYLYSYASFTTGANAVGQPAGDNANALLDWTDSYAPFSTFGWDISMGVAGNVIPEPSSFAVLGLGSVALVAWRRRGQVCRGFSTAVQVLDRRVRRA
jgi:hypothetical protein